MGRRIAERRREALETAAWGLGGLRASTSGGGGGARRTAPLSQHARAEVAERRRGPLVLVLSLWSTRRRRLRRFAQPVGAQLRVVAKYSRWHRGILSLSAPSRRSARWRVATAAVTFSPGWKFEGGHQIVCLRGGDARAPRAICGGGVSRREKRVDGCSVIYISQRLAPLWSLPDIAGQNSGPTFRDSSVGRAPD